MPDIQLILLVKIAFAKRKVINCIQKIGLPDPVIPDKTIDFTAKLKIGFCVIFKIR
jgi:hypothetical protein